MTKRLKRVGPLKLGIVMGLLQAILSLILIPFYLLFILAGAFLPHQTSDQMSQAVGLGMGLVFCVLMPFLYAILGFIFGCLAALVYNLVAKFTGGIEFEID